MTREAEEHAKEDEEKKGEIETRNQADALVYQAEKALKDGGDKVPEDIKKDVEEKIKAVKDIQASGAVDEVKQKTEELSSVLSKIGESMYKGAEGTEGSKETDGQTKEESQSEGKNGKKSKDEEGEVQEGEVVKE